MAWVKNGTPNTLGSAGDDMDITDLTAYKFNQIMVHTLPTGGAASYQLIFNNDSNTVYARRGSYNGGADSTATSQSLLAPFNNTSNYDIFTVWYVCSISGEEKLSICFTVEESTSGATTAPDRVEYCAKFVPSPDADITRVDAHNGGAGDLDTGSNISALGTD